MGKIKEYIFKRKMNIGKSPEMPICKKCKKGILSALTRVEILNRELEVIRIEDYHSRCCEKVYPDVAGLNFKRKGGD